MDVNQLTELEIKYYCGNCNETTPPDFKLKCRKCRKTRVKWYISLQPKSYAIDNWNNVNRKSWLGLFNSESTAFGIVWFGFGFAIILVYLFYTNGYINKNTDFSIQNFTGFADIIGGVVGAVWSLSGIILFYLALKNQMKNSAINQEVLLTQVNLLNNQTAEYKNSLVQSTRIAAANEKTLDSLIKQIDLMQENLNMDKKALLINSYTQLARSEPDGDQAKVYLNKAKTLIHQLKQDINE